MTPRSNTVKLAAGALALAGIGGVGGAAVYASFAPGTTTTVVASSPPLGSRPVSGTRGLSANEIYRLAAPGVVQLNIVGTDQQNLFGGGPQDVRGVGTGFVYDRLGDIVTNDHVAGGARSITVKFSRNQTFEAHVVGRDPDTDLAVIKVSAPSSLLHPLTLGDSTAAQVGDGVVAIGSAFGRAGSLSAGVVSGLHHQMASSSGVPIDGIQTDAAFNPGSSGGPLLNALGQVIGVATYNLSRSPSGASTRVGFVVPSNTVRSVVLQLVAGHEVEHAYFGALLEDSTSPLGARLVKVLSAAPSAQAGLKRGDLVTSMDGVGVGSSGNLIGLIRAHNPGDTVSIGYVRGGKSHTVEVELRTRPA